MFQTYIFPTEELVVSTFDKIEEQSSPENMPATEIEVTEMCQEILNISVKVKLYLYYIVLIENSNLVSISLNIR